MDGFVADAASCCQIEVHDVRPISSRILGLTFRKVDLMDDQSMAALVVSGGGSCDSLSCPFTIEHFGMCRYGDPIDPTGYARGP